MSADRWYRLADELEAAGIAAKVDRRTFRAANGITGVSHSMMIRRDGRPTVEVRDTWWPKNDTVWTGWQVDITDRDGFIVRSLDRTKSRADVVRFITTT